MLTSTGTSRSRASSNASLPHGRHSTGLSACARRYGLVDEASRFVMSPPSHPPTPLHRARATFGSCAQGRSVPRTRRRTYGGGVTDDVPSSPDQNDSPDQSEPRRDAAPRPPHTDPNRPSGPGQAPGPGQPADPGPQPGPYVYSPHPGEQPPVPVQAAPPAGPHAAAPFPGGPYAAGPHPAGPHLGDPSGPHLGAHDPRTPLPGSPFGSSYRTPRTRW